MWYWKIDKRERGITYKIAVNVCERCNVEYRSDSPSASKYCPSCAEIIRKEQNRERVRRFRAKQKAALKTD